MTFKRIKKSFHFNENFLQNQKKILAIRSGTKKNDFVITVFLFFLIYRQVKNRVIGNNKQKDEIIHQGVIPR